MPWSEYTTPFAVALASLLAALTTYSFDVFGAAEWSASWLQASGKWIVGQLTGESSYFWKIIGAIAVMAVISKRGG